MNGESSRYDKLESMLQDGYSEPHNLPLKYLRNITNNFSDERLLGKGGFGTVYKGVLQNGKTIAVKKFNSSIPGVKDKQFENEANHLMRLKHPNVVLLVGWCFETENMYVEYNGKYIWAEKLERLLCLEYVPKGNLRGYLSDAISGLGWDTRYKIIEGICYGLHYLHEQWQPNAPIVHMDLKPANILLDNNMVPKIADFGLSRLFNEEKTWTRTISRDGTLGYMSPEYINKGLISTKSDIFSLGVIIIEVVTGHRDYPDDGTSSDEFIETVLNNWTGRRVEILFGDVSPEVDYQQIRRCIQIGLDCVKIDRYKRPTISQIIKTLHGPGSADSSNIKRGIPEQMDVPAPPPSSQPANTVQAAQPAQAAVTSSGPNANPLDLFPQSLLNASAMPTPVPAARQCLAPAAVTALDAAVASARRRAHAQTTSLHLIASLLAPTATPLLRDALARARSATYSPRLLLKALNLCFAVSLDRLPSAPTHSASASASATSSSSSNDQHEPPVANSLMAAIKRSQANQRRNPDMFHFYHHQAVASTSSPNAVKVDLSHLVLAILDDPLVSHVFTNAGFRSDEIKVAVLRPCYDNPEDHVSPSSAAPVATDLVLATPRGSSSKDSSNALCKHVEDAEGLMQLMPKKVDDLNLKPPHFSVQPYTCSRSSSNWDQTSPSALHSATSGGASAFGQWQRSSPPAAQSYDLSNYKLLMEWLFKAVGRQEEALSAICASIVRCRSMERHRDANKKNDIWFSFYGPDSIAKQRVGVALAELMHGNSENLIYLDLSLPDWGNPNFRGKCATDCISEELRKKRRSVIFLDNIDKADCLVQESLIHAMETGRYKDLHGGRVVDLNDSIVVLSTRMIQGCQDASLGMENGNAFSEEKVVAARGHQLKIIEPGTANISGGPGGKVVVSSRHSLRNSQASLYSSSFSKRKLHISDGQEKTAESPSTSKRLHRTSSVPFYLNLSGDEAKAHDGDDDSSSSHENSSGDPKGSVGNLLRLVDESINFKPFDLANFVRTSCRSSAIVSAKLWATFQQNSEQTNDQ